MKNQPAHSSALAAKVAATNRANETANRIAPALLYAMTPFYGAKVVKTTGELMQKAKDALTPLLPLGGTSPFLQVWISTGHGYSLTVTVKTCESFNGCAHYADALVYLANLKNGIAEAMPQAFTPRRVDYDAGEVRRLREAYEVARKAASDAQSALFPFGEHDR